MQQQQNEAHLTLHEQTLLPKPMERVTDKNCKLLVNDLNFKKVVLEMEGLSTPSCTLMKDEPLQVGPAHLSGGCIPPDCC